MRLPNPGSLVIDEEECLVFHNGSAEGPAELVLLERRDGQRRIVKVISGVQRGIPQKLVRTPVELVGPGLQHDVHHRAAPANVGSKIVGLNLEFLDGINRRLDDFEANLLLVVVKSVQQEVVVGRHQSVCLNRSVAALVLRNASLLHDAGRALVDPGTEVGKLDEVSPVKG